MTFSSPSTDRAATVSLSGCHALVTGAGSGIGRAIARALGAEGASVWLAGRRREALDETAAADGLPPGWARAVGVDLADDAALLRLGDVLDEAGGVDVLVHSAGLHVAGRWEETDVGELDRLYRVNVRAPYLLTRRLLPSLIARQGQVVFVNSSAGMAAKGGVGAYAATKHALRALADSLRDEVNGAGVRVLSAYPGRTAGPMQEALFRQEGRPYPPDRLLQPEDVAAAVVHTLRLPRTAEVTDLHLRPFRKA